MSRPSAVPCPVHERYAEHIICPDQAGDTGLGCMACAYLIDELEGAGLAYWWVCPFCSIEGGRTLEYFGGPAACAVCGRQSSILALVVL